MPLPPAHDYPEPYGDQEINFLSSDPHNEGVIERVDSSPRTNWGMEEYGELTYLGSGYYGIAYGANGGNVIKLTRDKTEHENALRIMGMGEDPSGVVKVFNSKDIGNGYFVLELEKVRPISNMEKEALHYISIMERSNVEYEEMWDMYRQHAKTPLDKKPFYNFTDKYMDLMLNLFTIGMDSDIHRNNVGKSPSTGELVLLDIGSPSL
jgi:hypothetical protein